MREGGLKWALLLEGSSTRCSVASESGTQTRKGKQISEQDSRNKMLVQLSRMNVNERLVQRVGPGLLCVSCLPGRDGPLKRGAFRPHVRVVCSSCVVAGN